MTSKYQFGHKKSYFEAPKRHLNPYLSVDRLQKQTLKLPNIYDMKQSWLPTKTESKQNLGTASFPGAMSNGVQKTNQDSIIVDRKLNFYAVADGHGVGGEKVSGFIRVTLPRYIEQSVHEPRETLVRGILDTNHELWNSKIETALAGSTLTSVWIRDKKLYTANVGDSRCVMGRQTGNSWLTIELTKDHKPSREDEAIRILKAGGRIAAQQDIYGNQLGPLRVWMKTINAPGLAMTRSMGDKVGAQAGVIAQPEIQEFILSPNDKFIILASDGVWEYLQSQDVVSLISSCFEKNMSADIVAQKVLNASIDAWKRNSLARDDISCIIIYL